MDREETARRRSAMKSQTRGSQVETSQVEDDERLRRAFRMVWDAMTQKPSLNFPAACRGRAEEVLSISP